MKKFKKKSKSIKRSHQKIILKRSLWLAPLLISGFASGVHANGTDILRLSWGEKSQKVCVHHPWYAIWSCDKWEEKTQQYTGNQLITKTWAGGNAANYYHSQNNQDITANLKNDNGTYFLSGLYNYTGGENNGGNLDIELGSNATFNLGASSGNSFTSWYPNGHTNVTFSAGTINVNNSVEVGNRVGSGAGTHTGTATLNLNANKVNINSNISAFKTSQVNIGNANSTITINSVSLNGDTCSSLARVGVGANCSTSGPSYSFKGTTNATNTTFSNANGSFTFEESATFSGAKWNGGAFTFNKGFSATNNTAFNSGSFTFKDTSSFNNATFNNVTYTFNNQATFQNSSFNGGTFTFNNQTNPANSAQHPQILFENSSFSGSAITLKGSATFEQAFNNSNHQLTIQNASFDNATFNNTGKITINESASFNNTSFNTPIDANNMTISGGVTLSGKNDLKNGSTLDFGSSKVTLAQGATFNLTSLGDKKSVTILNSSGGITYNHLLNHAINSLTNALKTNESSSKPQSFAQGLWDMITYNGVTGQLLSESAATSKNTDSSPSKSSTNSTQVYQVGYKIGDTIYKLQETFGPNSIIIQALESGTYTPPPVINGSKFDLSASNYINADMPWYDHKYYIPKSQNFAESGTYYLPSVEIWGSYTNSFKQTFSANGSSLVIGYNATWTGNSVSSSGTVSFGDTSGSALSGHCGTWPYYQCAGTTDGVYSAYHVYITANLRSGNRIGTGGAANLVFNGVDSVNIANAKIEQYNAGIYSSSMTFSTQNMDSSQNLNGLNANGKLSVYGTTFTNQAKDGKFIFNAGQAVFENTNFNGGSYQFSGDSLNFSNNNQFNSGSFEIGAKNALFNNANFNNSASFNFNNSNATTSFVGDFTNAHSNLQIAGNAVFGNSTNSDGSQNTANFNNTGSVNIVGNATFDNVVFNSPTNTSVKGKVTLNNITLKNLNAPLSFGDGTIGFSAHSVINIDEAIINGNPITLVSSSKEIEYNNAFSKNLWQLINYQGHGASSEKLVSSAGNGIYDVVYSFNNQTYNFQEVFSPNSISIRRLGVGMVFDYMDMEKSDHLYYQNALGFMTYMPNSYNNNLGNANNTIYYYDNSIDFYASGKTLFTKAEFSQMFTGQNSAIVFGAKSIWTSVSDVPKSNVIIRFGDNKGAGSNDASGHCWNLQCIGFITGHYEAQKIYITGSIESGNRISSGGGASLNFNGLQGILLTNATLYNRAAGTQSSSMNFVSNSANIQAQNSYFIDDTAQNKGNPNFSFNALNLDFSNSSFRGYVGTTQSVFKFNAANTISFTNSSNLSSGLYQMQAKSVLFDNSNLSVSVGTSSIKANAISLSQNASINASNHSTLELQGDLNLNDTSSLNLNQSAINVSNNATINDYASLIASNGSHLNFNGAVNFNSANITTSLNNSSIVFKGSVSLGGQFNLSNNSSLDFQGSSAITSNTAFNFYDNAFSQSPITFHQALDVKAPLSLGGNLLNPNNNSVLNLKNSQLVFSDQGSLNIANIDLLSDLNDNKNRVYNIIQADMDMNGNWYERINFFGMRINDGIYDAKNQTYSFTNPLNNALKITESFKDNQLSVTLSQIPGIKNTLYNIGSEIFNYQKVYNNANGVYSYSDDAQGVFYLTSSVKGYYNPNQSYQASGSNNTTKNNNISSESSVISQTYNAQGNPISALHVYNKGYSFSNIKALGQMALKLYPEIKKILGNDFSLSSLSNLKGDALNQLTKLITPSDWKNINELIDNANNSVVQNFNNGALIIGATQIGQTNTNSAVVFGGLGYQKPCDYTDIVCQKFRGTYLGQLLESSSADLGYIDTTFNAKEIYLTGTLGSGNAWGTGGSASVTFNSQTSLILNQANIVSSQIDGIFSMLGQEGINKVFNQAGLANILGEVAMQSINKAGGLGNLIVNTLGSGSVIGGYLTPEQKNQTLSQLLGQNNFDNLMNDSGLNTAIKDLIRQKLGFWTGLVGGLAGLGGIDLQNPEKLIGSMSINDLLSKKGLFNQITGFISANDIGQVISVMLQDIVKPSEALQNDVAALGKQMIGEFLGQDTLNSLESLLQNQQIKSVLDKVLAAKGLGPIYEQGLGDLIPNLGNKGLFAPYGLSQAWQKGDFSFNAQGNVFVQNSTFSNANGGTLSFNAGNSLIFAGNNHIAFTNHFGTLNLLSNQVSNINITTLDASNGLKINAGNNNVSVSQGDLFINASCTQQSDPTTASTTNPCTTAQNNASSSNASNNAPIALNNNDESLVVAANGFNFSGNIYANGVVDFSKIKGSANVKNLYLYNNAQFQANNLTISNQAVLEKNASFVTNNLNIQGAFNNNTTQKIEVLQNLVIASNASLSTGIYGLEVGGALNNLGTIHFNLENIQTPVNPLIQAEGIINLNTTQTPFMNVSVANGGTYTLLKSSRYINYNISPDSLQSYLKLYTLININGNHIEEKNGVLTYLGQRVLLQDKGLLLSVALPNSNNASPNNILSLSVLYNQVKMSYGNKAMDFTPPTLQDYIAGIQGQSALNQIEAIGGNSAINWLSTLMMDIKENPLFAPIYLKNHSLNEILGVTKDLQNTASLISNPNFRDNATNLLELASYTQQTSRLTKLSDFRAREGESNFSERLLELKNKRFSDPNPSEVFVKYSQPNKHPNNLWVQGVGGASFIAGGNGTLYGLNAGYDRLVKNVILGGYVAYGYSDFNGRIIHSLANNVDVGVYARAFLKRNEFTLSANETYGGNATNINSSNPLLSVINQRYHYNTWTTSVNGNYGYDFMFKQKSVVLKPQVGLSYHFIGLSGMKGKMQNPAYQQFVMHSNPSNESVLTLNMGLESRKYFGKNSYYFVTARLGRDLLIKAKGGNMVRFVGENTLLYRKGEIFNTFASVITGGEMHLWRLMYVNAGVGLKMGLQYQDINITGNVGMRVAF
ncbi:vacuolating cytotoxin domain-containing protein [Helicobacter pylori]|uniref:immunomodulatory autotransporter protein ImaA n=1 Tax=Helicobacter pylori TaxID=210 RepID=UPI000EABAC2A|nr:vacuolating cytotoxin domain-containing protein [Helicobacter pylori]